MNTLTFLLGGCVLLALLVGLLAYLERRSNKKWAEKAVRRMFGDDE